MDEPQGKFTLWGQGDVSLDVTALPHVTVDDEIADVAVRGVVVISQTCDIVNGEAQIGSPALIQVAGLLEQTPRFVEEVRRFRRPRYLYVPAVANQNLVADLELVATYDREILTRWQRLPAPDDSASRSHCSFALGRQRSRHAFPDLWAEKFGKLRDWMKSRAGKNSDEGRFVDSIEEVRVVADDVDSPASVDVICLIPAYLPQVQRQAWAGSMCATMRDKFDPEWCSDLTVRLATTQEMTAAEYLSARPLDFDAMSRAANDDAPKASQDQDASTGAKSRTIPEVPKATCKKP